MTKGRLKRTTIHHMYDDKGTLSGHKVVPEYEPDSDDAGGNMPMSMNQSEISTPHETHDSALAKASEYHAANMKRFGGKKKKSTEPMPEEMRKAMSR